MKPKIIVLDGPSGVGKTALAKAMQEELLPDLWMNFSIDSLVYALPDSVLERCNKYNDWSSVNSNALFLSAFSCVNGIAKNGNSVIFDIVITDEDRADELRNAFSECEFVVVGVFCEWGEIKRRTMDRGDRTLREAEYGFNNSPKYFRYDVIVNTTSITPLEAARECIESVREL